MQCSHRSLFPFLLLSGCGEHSGLSNQALDQNSVAAIDSRAATAWESSIDRRILKAFDMVAGHTVTRGWLPDHMGTDIARRKPHCTGGAICWENVTGQPVYAIGPEGSAVNVKCWYEPLGGQNVSSHASGMSFAFDYAHLDSCIAGQRGEITVLAGTQIGTMGNSGSASTGPHLHFQMRDVSGVPEEQRKLPTRGVHKEAYCGFIERALDPSEDGSC